MRSVPSAWKGVGARSWGSGCPWRPSPSPWQSMLAPLQAAGPLSSLPRAFSCRIRSRHEVLGNGPLFPIHLMTAMSWHMKGLPSSAQGLHWLPEFPCWCWAPAAQSLGGFHPHSPTGISWDDLSRKLRVQGVNPYIGSKAALPSTSCDHGPNGADFRDPSWPVSILLPGRCPSAPALLCSEEGGLVLEGPEAQGGKEKDPRILQMMTELDELKTDLCAKYLPSVILTVALCLT